MIPIVPIKRPTDLSNLISVLSGYFPKFDPGPKALQVLGDKVGSESQATLTKATMHMLRHTPQWLDIGVEDVAIAVKQVKDHMTLSMTVEEAINKYNLRQRELVGLKVGD